MEKSKVIYGHELKSEINYLANNPILVYRDSDYPDEILFSLDNSKLSRHMLLLGGAGSGKTNVFNLTMRQLREKQNANDIFIVFDTKGDFCNDFWSQGDYILGNGKQYRNYTMSWNIFDEVLADGWDKEDYEINAREIAAGLFVGRGSESQPFFVNAARDIFAHIIIHYIRQYEAGKIKWEALNNKNLVNYILTLDTKQYIKIFTYYKDMRGMLSYFGDGKSNQALGVFAELKGMLHDCFLGVFANDSSRGRFSMRQAVKHKGGRAVFIEYDLTTGETMTPIYRLLVDLALKEALGRGDGEPGNVYLVLDELKLLPKLQHLDDALNFGRSKGVKVIAGIQTINQLYDIYGETRGHVLAGGFATFFAFHTSDSASRNYVSELIGKNVTGYEYKSLDGSIEKREREGYVVESWDQLNLKIGQAIVLLADKDDEPFFFKFQEYKK